MSPHEPLVDLGDAGFTASLGELDPVLARLVAAEAARQDEVIDMVASENFVPRAILEVQGSVLTNKYADGYPKRRLYDGCEIVDEIETLAIDRAKALFGAGHANVQAYSGSNANAAVIQALCEPGDAILGFEESHGGHPTHHWAQNFAGRFHKTLTYHVRASDRLVDMDEVRDLAKAHRPRLIIAGWSLYSRVIDVAGFREIADEVGAFLLVDMAHFSGLVAAGLHPDPVPYADACTMTTHKTLGGARAGAILCREELGEKVDFAVFPATQGGPLMHVIAANAVTFGYAATKTFRSRMERTVEGARTIARVLHDREAETSCAVVTGGTDVHQFHLDVFGRGVDAAEAIGWLHAVGINANDMALAYDRSTSPTGSGLRLGTTSLATRGFSPADFEELGAILVAALAPGNDGRFGSLKERTRALASAHRPYEHPPAGRSDDGPR